MGALAVRPIPVYPIMLMNKNDSKPESNRFYQWRIDASVIRVVISKYRDPVRFCSQIVIVFISYKKLKKTIRALLYEVSLLCRWSLSPPN